MILDRARSQLLVVDVQERLISAMHEGERMIDRCAILMQSAQRLGLPVTLTEQYPKGLGGTVARLGNIKGDAPVLEKFHFSCAADNGIRERVAGLVAQGRNQIVVCGIESHVCVLQSALGFKDLGFDIYLAADAVTSRHPENVTLARARLGAAGITAVSTEMAVFEWLHVAGTPEFKDLSKLIK